MTRALHEATDTYLQGTGIELQAGDYGSWIEVVYTNYNHNRSDSQMGDAERVRREPPKRDRFDGERRVGNGSGRSNRSPDRSTRGPPS